MSDPEEDAAIELLEKELGAEVVKTVPNEVGAGDFQGDQERDSTPTGRAALFYKPQWNDEHEEVESAVLNGHEDVEGGSRTGVVKNASYHTDLRSPSSGNNPAPERDSATPSATPPAPSLPERPYDNSHVDFRQLMAPDRPKPKPLLSLLYDSEEHIFCLPREIVRVSGLGKAGKSFLLLELTEAIALGRSQFACFHIAEDVKRVMWIDEEGSDDILAERLELIRTNPKTLNENFRYYLNTGVLLDKEWSRKWLFNRVEEFCPDVIVIDSATRVHAGDENDAGHIARLYNLALAPLSRVYRATCFVIDHTTWEGKRPRGSTDKINQVDRAWLVRRQGRDILTIEQTDIRRGPHTPRVQLRMEMTDDGLRHRLFKVYDE